MTDAALGPGDDLAERSAKIVAARTSIEPLVGIVVGSGLGPAVSEHLSPDVTIPFAELPGFPEPGVPGHDRSVAVGTLAGVPVIGFLGRVHVYEGHGIDAPALVPRLAHALGVRTLVVTAAVGGLVRGLAAGTIVALEDHLNFLGESPLRGWRTLDGSPTFVPMKGAYDPGLRALALARARALGIEATSGVYAAMPGPAYETPAEVRFLASTGATVVGMSVVPEVVPARALGLRVLGLAVVTNAFGEDVSHADVLRVSSEAAAALGGLLTDLLPRMEGV